MSNQSQEFSDNQDQTTSTISNLLLMNIALCNDVVVVQSKNGPEYHG